MNRYNAQILKDKGEYHLQFETDSKDNFKAVEKAVRKCIDRKPPTNFDKITESVESLAKLLVEESKQYDRFNEVVYWGYGELGRTSDINKAIKSTIKWLKQEAGNA